MLVSKECFERGCSCYDDRVDKDPVEVVKREWVGLTGDERHQLINDFVACCGVEPTSADINVTGMYALMDQIEAKLKEKNK